MRAARLLEALIDSYDAKHIGQKETNLYGLPNDARPSVEPSETTVSTRISPEGFV